jgi:hypothetical protein
MEEKNNNLTNQNFFTRTWANNKPLSIVIIVLLVTCCGLPGIGGLTVGVYELIYGTPPDRATVERVENSEGLNKDESSLANDDVVLTASVDLTADKKLVVNGKTNLPDGTELLISVESSSVNFNAQTKSKVEKGEFAVTGIGSNEGMTKGQYQLEVVMPIPTTQSEAVRAIIGSNGENLRGPFVERGVFGTTVRFSDSFSITEQGVRPGTSLEHLAVSARKEAERILEQLKRIEREGREMEQLRNTNDLAKVKKCGELMRANKLRLDELRNRVDKLPKQMAIHLGIAIAELSPCVSCANQAIAGCQMAQSTLREAESAIKEVK